MDDRNLLRKKAFVAATFGGAKGGLGLQGGHGWDLLSQSGKYDLSFFGQTASSPNSNPSHTHKTNQNH